MVAVGTLLRLAWDPGINGFHRSAALKGDLVPIGEDHLDLSMGFSDSFLAWGTSLAWSDDQQGEFRGSSCREKFISTGIRFYLQVPTLGVHEMDDLEEKLHVETDNNLYDYDSPFTGVM